MIKAIKFIVFLLPFVTLFCLIIMAFFQHPSMDDYAGDLLVKRDGLSQAIYLYLLNSNGRYFVVPVFLWLTSCNFFLDNYFILLIAFILYAYISFYYFIKFINVRIINIKLNGIHLHWVSALFFIACLSVLPEPSSFIYWLTTNIVYLLPFTLFLFFIIYLITPFFSIMKINKWDYFFFLLILFLLVGSNEVSLFFSYSFLIIATLSYFILNNKLNHLHLVGIIVQTFFTFISFILPGNVSRSEGFSAKQHWIYSIISGIYQTVDIFSNLFLNPLFWFFLIVIIFCSSTNNKVKFTNFKFQYILIYLGIIVLLNFFFCFSIRQWTGWVVPERSKNIMVLLTMFYIFLIAYIYSFTINGNLKFLIRQNKLIKVIFIVVFLFNPLMVKIVNDIALAPIHNLVLKDRIKKAELAIKSGRKSITLEPYKVAMKSKLYRYYGRKVSNFIYIEFEIPPLLVYFKDEPFDPGLAYLFGNYYSIDTINTPNKIIYIGK